MHAKQLLYSNQNISKQKTAVPVRLLPGCSWAVESPGAATLSPVALVAPPCSTAQLHPQWGMPLGTNRLGTVQSTVKYWPPIAVLY